MPAEVRPEPVHVTPLTVRITHPELSTWLARGQRSGVFTSTGLTLFCEETLISYQWLWGHWTISFEGYVFTAHICVCRRTNAFFIFIALFFRTSVCRMRPHICH